MTVSSRSGYKETCNYTPLKIFSINCLSVVFLILLLSSVESSLQTSIVWDRSTAWTLWLYKVWFFSIADLLIITITVITLFKILKKPVIPSSPYLALCALALFYLYIGLIYNLSVFTFWKTYLYDFKVVLYFIIPYLFLNTIKNKTGIIGLLTPKRIFIYTAISGLIDFTIVNLFGQSEYAQFLGYIAIPVLFPMSVLAVGIIYSHNKLHKLFFFIFLCFEFMNAVNRISLGVILSLITSLFFIFVLRWNLKFGLRVLTVGGAILAVNLGSILLIQNPFGWFFLDLKADGALTRQIQMQNAIENFSHNIPGVIGKGLGSTWFEYIPISETDIYSVGTSVGSTPEEAISMPVKFIFNFEPPALLHKWGIIGTICLFFFLARYYNINFNKIRKLRYQVDKNEIKYLKAILVLSFLFAAGSFTYIGSLKPSLITSLLAFYIENKIRSLQEIVGISKC